MKALLNIYKSGSQKGITSVSSTTGYDFDMVSEATCSWCAAFYKFNWVLVCKWIRNSLIVGFYASRYSKN